MGITLDNLKDMALLLRSSIIRSFREMDNLPWPPTANDLDLNLNEQLPKELIKFIYIVLDGTESEIKCEKTERLVYSIGQDLCRAVTDGEWKLPKHILLCATVRHMYRSRQLASILNKLGHCESYDFGLELETALARAIDESSTLLTPQIVCGEGNEVFHMEWDNLNKITTNVHGSNVVNSAAGIMLQEIKPGFVIDNQRTLPIYERSKSRSNKVDITETLPSFTLYNKDGTKFPRNAILSSPPENDHVYEESMKEYYAWLFGRIIASDLNQINQK